jgi:HlyD family secretion protein
MRSKKIEKAEMIENLGIKSSRSRRKKWIWIISILVIAGIAVLFFARNKTGKAMPSRYKTKEAATGQLKITVTATGTLKPTNQVDVGSELSGNLKSVDVQYNDHVKKGQVLATIDGSKYEAQLMQLKASLESSKAQVLTAETTEKDAQDKLDRFQNVWQLSGKKYPSKSDMDTAESELKRTKVNLEVAMANVSQAQANLEALQTDISKLVIRSPIDGIVLKRAYEPGQTVQASFQGVTLFTLAEDLSRMELHVDVDEADVGQVKEGQEATFTVDAYPSRTFNAKIKQVRYDAKTQNGVVTYETVLKVENNDLLLRPGMTATAEIVINKLENVMLIDNEALKFTPPVKAMTSSPAVMKSGMQNASQEVRDEKQQEIWIMQNNTLSSVSVTTGLTDGSLTEVTGGNLKPGMQVVTGTESEGMP